MSGDTPDGRNPAGAIELAAITGAHGITGEVRLKLFGDGLDSFKQHKSFNQGALTLKKLRDDNKGGAVARFAEITNRSDAEKMRGTVLAVPRDALPLLEEGEYYHADLIGLAAVSDTGEVLGEVIAVQNYGAGDILEIRRADPEAKGVKTFLVPMTTAAVSEWNSERLVIAADFADI